MSMLTTQARCQCEMPRGNRASPRAEVRATAQLGTQRAPAARTQVIDNWRSCSKVPPRPCPTRRSQAPRRSPRASRAPRRGRRAHRRHAPPRSRRERVGQASRRGARHAARARGEGRPDGERRRRRDPRAASRRVRRRDEGAAGERRTNRPPTLSAAPTRRASRAKGARCDAPLAPRAASQRHLPANRHAILLRDRGLSDRLTNGSRIPRDVELAVNKFTCHRIPAVTMRRKASRFSRGGRSYMIA